MLANVLKGQQRPIVDPTVTGLAPYPLGSLYTQLLADFPTEYVLRACRLGSASWSIRMLTCTEQPLSKQSRRPHPGT